IHKTCSPMDPLILNLTHLPTQQERTAIINAIQVMLEQLWVSHPDQPAALYIFCRPTAAPLADRPSLQPATVTPGSGETIASPLTPISINWDISTASIMQLSTSTITESPKITRGMSQTPWGTHK